MRRLAACVGLSLPLVAAAAPEEIKVFTDELAGYGESTLEAHVNKASRGAPLQLMPEYSYGVRRDWELSLQLPLALQDGVRGNGYRAELQYIAPHDNAAGFYWGVNFELAHISRAGEPQLKCWQRSCDFRKANAFAGAHIECIAQSRQIEREEK